MAPHWKHSEKHNILTMNIGNNYWSIKYTVLTDEDSGGNGEAIVCTLCLGRLFTGTGGGLSSPGKLLKSATFHSHKDKKDLKLAHTELGYCWMLCH